MEYKKTLEAKVNVYSSYQIMARTYFSLQHLQSAYLLCNESFEIEKAFINSGDLSQSSKNASYVSNTILSIVCFLEATINEFYADCFENVDRLKTLGDIQIGLLADEWKNIIKKRPSIVDKYQSALSLLKCKTLDISQTPLQDVKLIISLRNSLVHFKPEWSQCLVADIDSTEKEFVQSLVGRFSISRFFNNSGNAFFPHKCLGFGCASWAVLKIVEFVDNFYSEINIEPPYNHIRKSMPQLSK